MPSRAKCAGPLLCRYPFQTAGTEVEQQSKPTPAVFREVEEARRARTTPDELTSSIAAFFPTIVTIIQQCGLDLQVAVQQWTSAETPELVWDWIRPNSPAGPLISAWKQSLPSGSRSGVLATLVKEAQLSSRLSELGPYFRQYRMTYARSLRQARLDVGYACHKEAQETNLERGPDYYVRLLDLAVAYIGSVVTADRLDGEVVAADLLGRYGVATVLAGRFRRPALGDLRLALQSLRESIAGGNTHDAAFEYYIEGQVQLFDLTGDKEPLLEAARFAQSHPRAHSQQWRMNVAELWIKLAGHGSTGAAEQFVARARENIQIAKRQPAPSVIRRLRLLMLEALIESVAVDVSAGLAVDCQGFSSPFGVRSKSTGLTLSVERAIPRILAALSPLARDGEYLFREVAAELLSYVARHDPDSSAASRGLKQAIAFRDGQGWQNRLRGEQAELAYAEDWLHLASLDENPRTRHHALERLIRHAIDWPNSASALAVIALDIELNGRIEGDSTFNLGGLTPTPRTAELVTAIRTGRPSAVYGLAAAAASRDPRSRMRRLGGRSQVFAIDQSAALFGQTFVFKPMRTERYAQDEQQTRQISERISNLSLTGLYGVIEHLAVVPTREALVEIEDGHDVISVRKHVDSASLLDHASGPGADVEQLLRRTAEFLAVIHSMDYRSALPEGCRRQVREREVRCWLRRITADDPLANRLFESWWSVATSSQLYLRRRDAHAQNWLVDKNGRVLAVDLDCDGWRPLGYELAQLTDDHPLLPATEWASRLSILEAYVSELARHGVPVAVHDATVAYQAGLIARTIRSFSAPTDDEAGRVHATLLLQQIASVAASDELKEVALAVLSAWGEKTGLSVGEGLPLLPPPEKRRISRAMAYNLRHNKQAPMTTDGWVHVDELAELLRLEGHKVSSRQLLLIAGAMGEPRFQIDGKDVRATYGHSLEVAIEYPEAHAPDFLYHGTSTSILTSVAEARDGLRPMSRRRVHLTSDGGVALRAAARRKESTVLLRVATSELGELERASESTWLAKRVPATALRVVPVWEVPTQ